MYRETRLLCIFYATGTLQHKPPTVFNPLGTWSMVKTGALFFKIRLPSALNSAQEPKKWDFFRPSTVEVQHFFFWGSSLEQLSIPQRKKKNGGK